MEIAESSVYVRKTYIRCCVKECNSKADDRDSNIVFHLFPKPNNRFVSRENFFGAQEKLDILDAWKHVLKINHVTPKMRVCSLHFKKEDYVFPDIAVTRRYLRKSAVPSCNLSTCYEKQKDEKKNTDCLQRRNAQPKETQNLVFEMNKHEQITHETDPLYIAVEEIKQEVENCDDVLTANVQTTVNVETQVNDCDFLQEKIKSTDVNSYVNNSNEKSRSIVNNIKTNAELSTVTGIKSFEILDTIVQIVKEVYGNRFEDRTMKLKTRERIIMVYTKLKQNLSYSFLAIMFNAYTAKHTQRIFDEMIDVFSTVLKVSIPWSQKDETQSNVPKCFEGFEDTKMVSGFTEVNTQNPKEVCCQIITKAISLKKKL